ncbi:hypothetical protein Salat_2610400 [Sesamum alatum]|uniref:Retrotransposon Copia-like N-terminal domain-containing protein n=1 Tax=Sesamum alatum TaxID=300844 RepID=A0AAE1XPB6_9LAMI|nr:hypothetical protein Salat_2610400 [Sesamum alatum]
MDQDTDFLHVHGSDNPGMILITSPLNGTNYTAWRRAMEMIGAFMYTKMARELWVKLEERFSESNGPWFIRFKEKLPQILKATAESAAMNQLIQFLMGLNESFDNKRNKILVMDPMPSVNKAYTMVVRVEKHRFCCHGGQTGRAQARCRSWTC